MVSIASAPNYVLSSSSKISKTAWLHKIRALSTNGNPNGLLFENGNEAKQIKIMSNNINIIYLKTFLYRVK